MKRKIEDITTTTTTTTTTITTITTTTIIILKEKEEFEFEGEEEFKEEYFRNRQQRIRLSLPPPIVLRQEEEKEFEKGEKEFEKEYSFNGKQRTGLSLPVQRKNNHNYQKQICEFFGQSKFSSHDLFHDFGFAEKMIREVNREPRSSVIRAKPGLCVGQSPTYEVHLYQPQDHELSSGQRLGLCPNRSPDDVRASLGSYRNSNTNIFDIPDDILRIIIIFTDIIGKHVFRFISKYFHNIVHSVVVSNLLLPKMFFEYDYQCIAAGFGYILLFDWVIFTFYGGIILTSDLNIAARNGNLDLMKHMKKCYNYKFSKRTCYEAAAGGHLDVLKWLKEGSCPWDESTCSSAAFNGHLDVLKWLRENECPWDEETCSEAASNGNFEALRAALARNIKMG
jgi:hypothetical protein